ncbi:MAG: hypothetical protein JJ992_20245, partial [Planctomycetes bacterium]|nr:hypothetical protein [Planctomycetota bacterium]
MLIVLRNSRLPILVCVLFLAASPVAIGQNLLEAEAFLDGPDLGPGTGTPLELSGQDTDPVRTAFGALALSDIEPGPHTLYLRYKDSDGFWTAPIGQTLSVTPGNPGDVLPGADNGIEAAEAFIDVDPGEGNGIPLALARDGAIDSAAEALRAVISLDGLSLGAHVLYTRFLDSTGIWSPATAQTFVLADEASGPAGQVTLVDAVGRIDNGAPFLLNADDGVFDDLVETVTLQESVGVGYHSVVIRFRDSQGLWGDSSGAYVRDTDGDGIPDADDPDDDNDGIADWADPDPLNDQIGLDPAFVAAGP